MDGATAGASRHPDGGFSSALILTPSERHALIFFAAVALLGAAVRFHQATAARPPGPASQAALAQQMSQVDEARAKRATGRSPRERRLRVSQSPPIPSIASIPSTPLDLDTAPAESLDRLPRIGPALARRIVADRDSLGPFGSLEGFQRVKGVGPAMARTLAPYVTFSGTPRPSPVGARVSARRRSRHGDTRDPRVPP
jgi:competence protein ComEA